MVLPHATRALAGALLRDALSGRGPSSGPRLVPLDERGARALLVHGLTIGRGRGAALRVISPDISGVHARVVGDDRGFAIEDAGSKNGLRLNGRRVRGRAPLADGDVVELGPAKLRVEGVESVHPERRAAGPESRGSPPPLPLAAALLLAAAAALLAAAL